MKNKIKFFSNYASSEDLLKRFKDNYYIDDDKLSFTVKNDYDYAVVFNKTYEDILSTAKIVTIIQEPSWSPIHNNNKFLSNSDYLLIHDIDLFKNKIRIPLGGKIIETPSYMWYHDHIDKNFFSGIENITKKKKISIIVSSINLNYGLYPKRMKLLDDILKSDLDIDIYGKGLNLKDKRYKGEIENKFIGLIPYEYSICIENSREKNYVTEKFIDVVLCNTIPLYYGAPNIDDIYDNQGFINIDLNNLTIDKLKEITETKIDETKILENKNKYFNQYNLYSKLKEIII
jgi:hypothetical protein